MLESERTRLLAQLDELGFGPNGSLTYDTNFADSSQVTAERGEAERLAADLQEALDDVDVALARLADGTYGQVRALRQPDLRGAPRGDARRAAVPRLREAPLRRARASRRRVDHVAADMLTVRPRDRRVRDLLHSIILHEISHGWSALALGDDTAKRAGRLSLNPLVHIDPVGSMLLPGLLLISATGVLFGWAKPVPVNISRLRHPRNDAVLTSLAGPAMNLVLVAIALVALRELSPAESFWPFNLLVYFAGLINLLLGDVQPPAHPAARRQLGGRAHDPRTLVGAVPGDPPVHDAARPRRRRHRRTRRTPTTTRSTGSRTGVLNATGYAT